MIFRITAKAKQQLNVEKLSLTSSMIEKKFFFEWYVNVVYLNHKKYFHFTESKTLFSIFRHAKGVSSIESFELMFGKVLATILNDLVKGLNIDTYEINDSVYTKTENNNVRRAQIDHLYHAKHLLEEGRNTFDVNRYPIASIGFKMPVDYFIEELGAVLEKDAAIFISGNLRN